MEAGRLSTEVTTVLQKHNGRQQGKASKQCKKTGQQGLWSLMKLVFSKGYYQDKN